MGREPIPCCPDQRRERPRQPSRAPGNAVQQTLSTGLIFEVGQAILAAAETAGLFRPTGAGDRIHCTHAAGRDADRMRAMAPLRPGEGVAGRAVAEGRPIWTRDILDDPYTP